MSIGIKAKWIIAHDGHTHRLLRDATIITQGNHITYIGKDTNHHPDTWIDATHHTVIPGLICTHTHASTAPKDKSFIDDTGARHFYMSSLGENLTALGKSIKPQDHYTYSKYSIAELLKSGCTTILEIGMVDNLGPDKAVKTIKETGIRALQGPTISDGVWERTQEANIQTRWLDPEEGLKKLDKAEAFANKYKDALDGRLIPALYPDKVDTNSADLQKAVRAKADQLQTPVSIHAAQWVVEFQNMLRMHRRTPIEFLHDTGLLGPDLIIGHGWATAGHPLIAYPPVDGGDLQLLTETGTTVSHDPLVFLKRGNKMHSHSKYLAAGINVSIGCDTSPQDMLNEMRMASYTSKLADWDCHSGSSRDILNSATLGGAKGIRRPDLGRLAQGALADITVIDMQTINNVPCRDPVKNIVNTATRSDVTHVIVNGTLLVQDRTLLTIDEERLVKEVQRTTEQVWNRIPDNHYLGQTTDEVSPQSYRPWNQ